jgi:hypothetical protein
MERALQNEDSWKNQKNIEANMQKLVNEITCSGLTPESQKICDQSSYSVAYRTMFILPWYMYALVILILVFNLGVFIKLMTFFKKLNVFGYIEALLSLFVMVMIVLAIIWFSQGQIFAQFQKLSAPITSILPTEDMHSAVENAYSMVKEYAKDPQYLFKKHLVNGANIDVVLPPHGHSSLVSAEKMQGPVRTIVFILLGGLILILIYFQVTKKFAFWNLFKRKEYWE